MNDIDECSSSSSSSENDENVQDTSSLRPFNFEIVIAVVITNKRVLGTIIGILVGVTIDQCKCILRACVVVI